MKKIKRILSCMLVICMILTVVPQYTKTTYAATPNLSTEASWKANVIKAPTNGKLVPAGHIFISWYNVSTLGQVSKYKVYIDGSLKTTVNASSSEVMEYDYYSTKVVGHSLYIVAELTNGTSVKSDTFKFYVSKKGLGLAAANQNGGGMGAEIVQPSNFNLSWYYNWGYEPYKYSQYNNLEFVPMLWGNDGTIKNTLKINSIKSAGYKFVLGFNEPEAFIRQSNITVDNAIKAWPIFMNQGLIVGSPATALCPPWSDDWFQPFMKKINANSSLKVDFIAVHHYWDTTGEKAALGFLELIDKTYRMYKKPIWITEFAIGSDYKKMSSNDKSATDAVYQYAKIVLEGLNRRDFVERYAWFSFDTTSEQHGASGLYNYKTGALTNLGKLYSDIGNPDGYAGTYFNSYTPSGVDTTPNLVEPTTQKPTSATVKKPAKTKISSVKSVKAGQVKVSLKKAKLAKGYAVKYSTSSKFKSSKTKKVTKVKFTLKNLKKGKRYYIKARAYNKSGKKVAYSGWSAVKKVVVKKK